jgi:hypothetical protein
MNEDQETGLMRVGSALLDADGSLLTDFDTALAAQALFRIHRLRLAVDQFENFHRTHIDTLFAPNTFFLVNRRSKRH